MNMSKNELRLAMNKVACIHFVGIGGVGMSGIAEIFHNLGFEVSGSDHKSSSTTDYLSGLGITVYLQHTSKNVKNADVVVTSTAINKSNPEIIAANQSNITIIRRAEMLAELMRFKFGVAIAGTHGKTTTTSLVASILSTGGLDPTYVIGGKLTSAAVNAKLGTSRYLVAEADESDASFLHLNPMLAVVTNIDKDHMETYDDDINKLHHTFIEFIHNLPFYGRLIACVDDAGVQQILPKIHRQVIKYGFDKSADIQAYDLQTIGTKSHFKVKRPDADDLVVTLNMPGKHNVLNALAAIAVSIELDIDDASIINSLKIFHGVARRFQQYGNFVINKNTVTVVDDYGHHPQELAATIAATRLSYPQQRLVLIFQPHRFTRTRDLFDDFVKVLSTVDCLLLLKVYPAGESEITGATAKNLAQAIRTLGDIEPIVIDSLPQAIITTEKIVQHHDLLLISGAGDVGTIASQVANIWQSVVDE